MISSSFLSVFLFRNELWYGKTFINARGKGDSENAGHENHFKAFTNVEAAIFVSKKSSLHIVKAILLF